MNSTHTLFCVGVGSCVGSFLAAAMPVLQFIAVLITIAVGIKAFWPKRKKH